MRRTERRSDPIDYPISYPISASRYPISCPRSRAIRAAILVSCPIAKRLSEQLQLSLVQQLSNEQLTSVRERAQVGSKLGGGAPIDKLPGVVSNTAIHLKHLQIDRGTNGCNRLCNCKWLMAATVSTVRGGKHTNETCFPTRLINYGANVKRVAARHAARASAAR